MRTTSRYRSRIAVSHLPLVQHGNCSAVVPARKSSLSPGLGVDPQRRRGRFRTPEQLVGGTGLRLRRERGTCRDA